MPDRDELDRLLDSALATYADPGPDAGLEGRVLASLAAAREPGKRRGLFARSRAWLPWAIAVPVLASILLWMTASIIQHVPSRQAEQAQEASMHAPMKTTHPDASEEKHLSGAKAHRARTQRSARLKPCRFKSEDEGPCLSGRREVAKMAPLPKSDIFPTPQPLTAEERVLVGLARSASNAEREALLAEHTAPDEPLSIAALNVPPLAAPGEGKN